MTATEMLVTLFREVNTPDLRDICGEDEWIRKMRRVYHKVNHRLDCEIPLKSLLENAIEDVMGEATTIHGPCNKHALKPNTDCTVCYPRSMKER